jgi:hypothetical protein
MGDFYTYLWLRDDGTPYYVGKGRGERGFTNVGHRVRYPGKKFTIIQEWPSENDAFEAEKFLISYYGRLDLGTGCLANLTAGGSGGATRCGYTNTERQKQCVSNALKDRVITQEHRDRLSKAKLGKPNPAVVDSNIRRRDANPSLGAIRNRRYRAKKKEKELSGRAN